jgi:NAD(P)-dependent dehydrogenase (short-subunit alcohol dehydrogenase family)
MSNNVVLVTGALSGIGRATALAFARAGDRVVIAGRREDAGAALLAELRGIGIGAEADFFRADVSNEEHVRNMIDAVVNRFGRLDVAVNNAGTEGQLGPVVEQNAASYSATFDTNVLGTLLSMKHELRVMQPQGAGSIINLSSTFGHRGSANSSLYVASKHAVEGLTKSAALEAAAYNVRVNAVAPGPIDTEMLKRFTGSEERRAQFAAGVPLKRLGDVDDIADVIVFLASDAARYLTGQIIDVNGGKTAA